eukprot:scaffold31975_cov107-Isochrysis_galbana.AAC.3
MPATLVTAAQRLGFARQRGDAGSLAALLVFEVSHGRIRDTAKDRPITDNDVQSDGRPPPLANSRKSQLGRYWEDFFVFAKAHMKIMISGPSVPTK